MKGGWRWNAGRPGSGRPKMEDTLRLTTSYLNKRGAFESVDNPNARAEGTVEWNCGGKKSGSLGILIRGYILELIYNHNGADVRQAITLEAQPCYFGGRRFYFQCPHCGDRCSQLMFGQYRFACRKCNQGQYRSQCDDACGRSWGRTRAIQEKLGYKGDNGHLCPQKPKGMHYKTFEKLRQAFWAEDSYRGYLLMESFKRNFPNQFSRL